MAGKDIRRFNQFYPFQRMFEIKFQNLSYNLLIISVKVNL